MTTDTTQENSRKAGLHLPYLLFASVLVIGLLMLAFPGIGEYIRSNVLRVQSTSLPQAPVVTKAEVYIVVQGWDGQNSVLALDPDSGEVKRRFEAGYNAIVKLTANKHILYVFNAAQLSAINADTGATLWTVSLPGSPFGQPTEGAWLSADEELIYLQGSPDNFHPHIFAVDTHTGTLMHDFELPLPYPSNEDEAFPMAWKLPWDEKLVVASRDQLFTFDLTSGQTGDAIKLFGPNSIYRVPLNLHQTTFVWDGVMDPEAQQLFLATSTQEILVVDLNTQPFTVRSVVVLPPGWQYAVMQPLLYHAAEKAVYMQVRRSDAPDIFG